MSMRWARSLAVKISWLPESADEVGPGFEGLGQFAEFTGSGWEGKET